MIIWSQIGLQDRIGSTMLQLTVFHDNAILIMLIIISGVFFFVLSLVFNRLKCRRVYSAEEIETIWTVLPGVLLIALAIPSLRLLYLIDEVGSPTIRIKTTAYQWYWNYNYEDFFGFNFDSYMLSDRDLELGEHRLLEVDNRVVLPLGIWVRIIITSGDVIHSWAVPSLGVKVDAIPGRLNQVGFFTSIPGVMYGQCSEICGANHSFIPICLEVVSWEAWKGWIELMKEGLLGDIDQEGIVINWWGLW